MGRTTYGLDIAKSVMQLHWVDGETGEIERKKLARARLSEFFAQRQPARVAQAMRRLVDLQLQAIRNIERSIDGLEAEIAEQQRQCDQARTLREVPGIGLLGATALAATLGDASGWRSAREFAASLGLVPAHTGTGGKTRVVHLSKRGDPYLRTLLIHGARAVISHAKAMPAWLEQLPQRRPLNVAVVALANRMARTAGALVAHGRAYQSEWKSTPPRGRGAQAQAAWINNLRQQPIGVDAAKSA